MDALVVTKLQQIKYNYPPLPGTVVPNRTSIRVYSYDDERTKGMAKYPCFAVDRVEVVLRPEDKRPNHEIFVASTETQDVEIPAWLGGGTAEVPVSYERRPFPTPVDLIYEIHAVATNKIDYDLLNELIFQVFPPGYQCQVTGASYKQFALFSLVDMLNLEDLDKPEFRRVFIYRVSGLWLARLEHYTNVPIMSPDITYTAQYVESLVDG